MKIPSAYNKVFVMRVLSLTAICAFMLNTVAWCCHPTRSNLALIRPAEKDAPPEERGNIASTSAAAPGDGVYQTAVRARDCCVAVNGSRLQLPSGYRGRGARVTMRGGKIVAAEILPDGGHQKTMVRDIKYEGNVVTEYSVQEGRSAPAHVGFMVAYGDNGPIASFLHRNSKSMASLGKDAWFKDHGRQLRQFYMRQSNGNRLEVKMRGLRLCLGAVPAESIYYRAAREGRFWLYSEPDSLKVLLSKDGGTGQEILTEASCLFEIPLVAAEGGVYLGRYDDGGRAVIYEQSDNGGAQRRFKLDVPARGNSGAVRSVVLGEFWAGLSETVPADELQPNEKIVEIKPIRGKSGWLRGHRAAVDFAGRTWYFDPRTNSPLHPYLRQEGEKRVVFRSFGDKRAQIIIQDGSVVKRRCTVDIGDEKFVVCDEYFPEAGRDIRVYEVEDTFARTVVPVALLISDTGMYSLNPATFSELSTEGRYHSGIYKPLGARVFVRVCNC